MVQVVQINQDLIAGSLSDFMTMEDAIKLACKIIGENGVTVTDEIRESVEDNGYFVDDSSQWSVCIIMIG